MVDSRGLTLAVVVAFIVAIILIAAGIVLSIVVMSETASRTGAVSLTAALMWL